MKKHNELSGYSSLYIFNSSIMYGGWKEKPWEIINPKNGAVLQNFDTYTEAFFACSHAGVNPEVCDLDTVNQLRGKD